MCVTRCSLCAWEPEPRVTLILQMGTLSPQRVSVLSELHRYHVWRWVRPSHCLVGTEPEPEPGGCTSAMGSRLGGAGLLRGEAITREDRGTGGDPKGLGGAPALGLGGAQLSWDAGAGPPGVGTTWSQAGGLGSQGPE